MMERPTSVTSVSPEQEAIRAKCFHPTGTFVKFKKEEVEQSIPERFENIVNQYSDRLAIKSGNGGLTYNELNQAANRVADAIMNRRGPGNEPVGLLFGQGIEVIVAMFGILKTGKFFLPIDPSLPLQRISFMLGNSQTALVLTNSRHLNHGSKLANETVSLLNIDAIDGCSPSNNSGQTVSPDDLAGLLYTSGSTGEPKGVIQTHRTLLHATMRRTNAFHICSGDRLTLLASSTNQALMNILSALLNGARIHPFSVKENGINELIRWLVREEISIYHSSASVFRELVGSLTGNEDLSHIRLIRSASEAVTRGEVELYRRRFAADCIFTTGLSTSETGTVALYFIDKQTPLGTAKAPIGYPLEDIEILLLDENSRRVGLNSVGEIAIRSDYLSPGYWRRPELDRTKYVPDPEGANRRVYLTGDLGRMAKDGCIEHLGRKDFVIKLRGYSLVPGEIETTLLNHPGVKEAAVLGREKEPGNLQLIAYFVPDRCGPGVTELRGFLKLKLPDYMVPAILIRLDAMPTTANGKLDRRALPDPKNSRPELDNSVVAPRTPVEEKLSKIWSEVLEFAPIGIYDNFFELGGHSLLANRVLARIQDHFQVGLLPIVFFESPTVAGLAELIEAGAKGAGAGKFPHATTASWTRPGALSFPQQRLWFLNQLEPESPAYNLLSAIKLTGQLDVTALERSFNEIARRHEILRTIFTSSDGQPQQIILPSLSIRIQVVDLRDIDSASERESEQRRLINREARRPFDLARGPLLRVTLLQLAEDEHILVRAVHHIVFDGWSGSIVGRELSALYEAFSSGSPSLLPELSSQYADFARWQRQCLQSNVIEAQLDYWKQQLDGLLTLQLPLDRPRPPVQTHGGARRYLALSEALSAEIKSLSRRNRVTVFMTLLAAFQTLLHRYSGQPDIAVGVPVHGRRRRDTEESIGFFLNMLALRTNFLGAPTFRELSARVRNACLGAYSHQDLPFEKLVEELNPQRSLSHNPLFQVTFAFQNTPRFPLKLLGLTAEDLEFDPGIAKFDLHLFMEEKDTTLQGYLDFSTDLFDPETIDRMIGHFQVLLEGIVANPDEPVDELPLLTHAEQHKLLVEWNDTRKEYPADKCIHQLFEDQVEQTPEAVAVFFENRQLTYRQLNRRANQLARYLTKLGVGPEVPVGICVHRSLAMVVGLLGILKAGGAYVPLDPAYPKERMAFLLEDTQASIILTEQQLIERLPQHKSAIVCLDGDWNDSSEETDENLESQLTAENLAYVIYTSGSTGKPKGVAIEHRSAAAFLSWAHTVFTPEDLAGVLASTSICFDLSVFEIFAPLTSGGRLILADNALDLASMPAACGVTLVNTVPSAIAELLRFKRIPPSVRTINIAGEPLKTSLVRQIREMTSAKHVYDLYGPSEATTYSTCALRTPAGAQTIGGPIANTRIYLLDNCLQPVPIGVPGELHIAGAGLARGYLNRPEVTADKFIPDPFSNECGARLYKTGDFGRYLPDGNIEFLGRLDNQVKLHGFRIELGEIETVLGQHPAIREAVVVAREDVENPKSESENSKSAIRNSQFSSKRLVAYVVPGQVPAPTTQDLRSFVKQKLPESMAPHAFTFLDTMPLTPNGKVDYKALPMPDQTRPDLERPFIEPRTRVEEAVARIWAEVLRLERVGVHDNFFDLGGHSLFATQVIARIHRVFQMDIPLRTLFDRPTVEELAITITDQKADELHGEEASSISAELESLSEEETERLLIEQANKHSERSLNGRERG